MLQEALGQDQRGLPMVAAQSAVETAHWNAMWHWNFGNVTTADPSGDYQLLPGNPLHFKVYGSPAEGAADYVAWLRRRGVLDFALRGDLAGYMARLKASGYLGFVGRLKPNGTPVTDKEYEVYGQNIGSLINRFASMVPEALRPTPKKSGAVLAISLIAGAAYLLLYKKKT